MSLSCPRKLAEFIMTGYTTVETGLFTTAHRCLSESDPSRKVMLTREGVTRWERGALHFDHDLAVEPIAEPGRPERPRLVPPRELPRRSASSPLGRATLLHAIAHIEFNAINLAWDAVYRFRGLPERYYADWIKVAGEEALHFTLLRDYLRQLGWSYGDFDAHNGLWEAARSSADDPLVRMALVPRVLEARGLDVTPGMIERLEQAGDGRAVEILRIIHRDEVGHVEAGSRWFHYLCEQRGLEPLATFRELITTRLRGTLRGPFDRESRLRAGFASEEMDELEKLQ